MIPNNLSAMKKKKKFKETSEVDGASHKNG
jgi:hypothetical protein